MTKITQQTIAKEVKVQGVGLHSGSPVEVWLCPAEPNRGRWFRVLFPHGQEEIPAHISAVRASQLSTELAGTRARVRTIEHLLSALWGMAIDNLEIRVISDQPTVEMPILDGSALPWVEAIAQAGLVSQSEPQNNFGPVLEKVIEVAEQGSFVVALPSPFLQFTYGIEFLDCPIERQWYSWIPPSQNSAENYSQNSFIQAIAPARTFTLAKYIEPMRAQGLIKGGSLENAIVCDDKTWLNPPLRFGDEPCRHKLLDLIGDLSLLGTIPQAHYLAYKASHHLHCQLAKQLMHL